MAVRDKALIEAALASQLITPEQVSLARTQAQRLQLDELSMLCFQQRLPRSSFYYALARQQGFGFFSPSQVELNHQALLKMPVNLLKQLRVMPVLDSNDGTHLVTDSPPNPALQRQLHRLFGDQVKLSLVEPACFDAYLHTELETQVHDVAFNAVTAFQQLLDQAYIQRASDIHIEPQARHYIVRFRVDGQLQQQCQRWSVADGASLVSRIKVVAHLDIAETRMPQDGGASYTTPTGAEFDLRIATAPTKLGERVTIRLLGGETEFLTLKQLGMSEATLAQFRQVIAKPHGIILITGPTGSGKSTTLYAALSELRQETSNILTAEDPVEMLMPGISQVQMNAKVNFASALRSFLRHDPDVIMVGEIRDGETAEVALKAATTGHLVLSTLHTNSALASVTRLKNIGLEPFMIAASLQGVIAQRLARRLCSACTQSQPATAQQKQQLGIPVETELMLSAPTGCPLCDGRGYKGRIAIFETLWLDQRLRDLIAANADEQVLREQAAQLRDLQQDALEKLHAGLTSFAEVQRLGLLHVTPEDEVVA